MDTHEYWDQRHAAYGRDLRDVGDKRISSAQNEEQLIAKAAHLCWLFGAMGVPRDASLLDAGCGKGFITKFMADVGFDCAGVDVSAYAIENAVAHARIAYAAAPLETFSLGRAFDVILCADVLYHLVDDAAWARALENFLAHLKPGGALVIVEAFIEDGRAAPHVRWRAMADYEAFAGRHGLRAETADTFREKHSGDEKTILKIGRDGAR